MTELCNIAYKYGTDKCPRIGHYYTPFYYEIFKDKRESIKKVLELGIGFPECMDKFFKKYITGASLYMWRDFFPNASIYGADIDDRALFNDNRIKTIKCDEHSKENIENMIKIVGSDIDIFIDDGSHYVEEQVFLCETVFPLLKEGVFYSIEDVFNPRKLVKRLDKFDCYIPEMSKARNNYRNNLVIVRGMK
jgi:8-demethyl-8-alpha-L-rhamnosyltetracenomycin-C 2'-O-methyltransferase